LAYTGAGINSYMSNADGTITDGTKWSLLDPTSFNDIQAFSASTPQINGAAAAIGTSYLVSSTWTYSGSAPTIDGFAVKVTAITAVSGTVTIGLDQAGTDVSGTICTCNITDLVIGWNFFKLASPVTLAVTTAYGLKIKGPSAASFNTGTSTSNNHLRILRTTSTGTAPQNGASQNDNIFIMGEITGAGSVTTRTITWNVTSNTNPFNSIILSSNSVVNVENSASTNYYMRFRADCLMWGGNGVFNAGTSGTPIASTSTFNLIMASTSSVNCNVLLSRGYTFNSYGVSKTRFTTLAANLAAAGTSVAVTDATGWNVGDTVGFTATSTTATAVDVKALTSVSGNTIGFSAVTNGHLGTSPKIGHAVNLTNNVNIQGVTLSTAQGNFFSQLGANMTCRYTSFHLLGSSSGNQRGFAINCDLGCTFDIQYCSFFDGESFSIGIFIGVCNGTVLIKNNCSYNLGQASVETGLASGTGTLTVDGNCFTNTTTGNGSIVNWFIPLSTWTLTNNIMANGSVNGTAVAGIMLQNCGTYGAISGNTVYGCASPGIIMNGQFNNVTTLTVIELDSTTVWCCNSYGVLINSGYFGSSININGLTAFSNTTANIGVNSNYLGLAYWNNLQLQAGTTPATPRGILFDIAGSGPYAVEGIFIDNSNIGDVTGHSTGDLVFTTNTLVSVNMRNTVLGSTTPISGVTNFIFGSGIGSDRHQQINGNYAFYSQSGTITRDTTIFGNNSPSLRGTPTSQTVSLFCGGFSVAVPSGQTPTVSVRVRKSNTSAGDAATYNGTNQPFLIMVANPQAGINTTVTLATCTSASNGAWETLSGTIPAVTGDSIISFQVVCNGTTGWINVDDITTTQETADQGNMSFARGGQPTVTLGSGTNITKIVPILRKKAV
jgi:hypothetical protein